MHVGFPAPEPFEITRKRSGTPPQPSGSTIFSQNRHFTMVLARSRLLALSLPNMFFETILKNFQETSYFTSRNGLPGLKTSYFTMNSGVRKGQKMISEVAKTVVKQQFLLINL